MSTRRNFLLSSAATAALAATPRTLRALPPINIPIGLQLYTIRNQAETSDLAALLKQIHAIGYQEVETYWNLYSHPAPELRAIITDAGLRVPSGHFDFEQLEPQPGKPNMFDYAKALGLDWMVCPMIPETQRNSWKDFSKAAKTFNRWGQLAKDQGMRFAFHNHNYEFKVEMILPRGKTPAGNVDYLYQTGYDILVRETDPALVSFEMDCYWVTQANLDPFKLLRFYGKRIRMLHLKDRLPHVKTSQVLGAEAEHFTEVGNGTIEWRKIIEAAQKIGVEHYFVEQDSTSGPPMDSIRTSYQNLQRILA